ncbi:MAG: class I SAM-dependent methyltransferase [Alphaproteobacteria bacterium]|nr:MAG: class I SAM-dependent methyltransferase [Alphaproteobacteria bacterium]
MSEELLHDLRLHRTQEERAKQNFVKELRSYVLNDMADAMRKRYEDRIKPAFEAITGHPPEDGMDVHKVMKEDAFFKFYSSFRYNAQEMVWRSVMPTLERNIDILKERAAELGEREIGGTLRLDPDLEVPRNVTEIDVHLAPGGYHSETVSDDLTAGALYDNGLQVFSFGLMGRNLDDIGWSMAQYVRNKYPHFKPERILDAGCGVGHNSLPWAESFPQAEVHAVDVAAPLLRYAHARAQSLGIPVHFAQMDATKLQFEDESFDLVFSSMFLHELSLKQIRSFIAEARRVLKPGGLLLNMELPPNNQMDPYDSFYLDWDCYYNNEPYYKGFRDQDYKELCVQAGFDPEHYVQFISPQYTYMKPEEYRAAIGVEGAIDRNTGRLANGIQWFGFGAWK